MGDKSVYGAGVLGLLNGVCSGWQGFLQALFAGWILVRTVTEFHCGVPRYPHMQRRA